LVATDAYPLNPAVGRLYDGNQAVRFRKIFGRLALTIRSARFDDCRLLYQWATDPAVRAQSFSSEGIEWAKHKAWFIGQLVRSDRRFYVCEDEDGPAGLVRFSVEGEAALLGYSLCTRVRGKGYGLSMVHFAAERLRAEVSAVRRIDAYVKKENMASRITLGRLGYTELPTEDYPDALKFILDV
jgi:RimJ/RimL family protein N-acetyltransferase